MKSPKYVVRNLDSVSMGTPSLAEVISALSFALDLTEGAVPGHAVRSCLLGMRLAEELRFPLGMRTDLYHALLLKDVGCSSNAARLCQIIGGGDERILKSGIKLEDWSRSNRPKLSTLRLLWSTVSPNEGPSSKLSHLFRIAVTQSRNAEEMVQLRCDRGASIVRKIGMSEEAALAVRSLDEHWDGSGYPDRLRGDAISPLACILAVAQHLDAFALEHGPLVAMRVLHERSRRWFHPEVVRAAESLHRKGILWLDCLPTQNGETAAPEQQTRAAVLDAAPEGASALAPERMDLICEAFSEVVDAKSPFTFRHSMGVTVAAGKIGTAMQLKPERMQFLNRAALLHDLGKLRIPNSILDKPGKLDSAEWAVMQEHAGITKQILDRIPQFRELASVAGAHHEKLDGSGYPNHLEARDLPLEARILAVADVYGALTEDRPYRPGFPVQKALAMMEEDVSSKLDSECFEALVSVATMAQPPAPHPATLPAAVFANQHRPAVTAL